MAEGYLFAELRNSSEAFPIVGAQVKIGDKDGNILYELLTDENGRTETVTLKTLDRALSLDPNYAGHPYIDYTVEAEAPGFRDIIIRGVHILDGETAIQPVSMIPKLASGEDSGKIELDMGPFAVESTEERNQIGVTPENGPHQRVLPVVVMPSFVTVHLGRPDRPAQNVRVPFIEYIKNVTSHEIYSTWPENAIRANVHVIVTFTLNRVYTKIRRYG